MQTSWYTFPQESKILKKGPAIKGSSIRKHSIFNMQGKQDPFGAF